MHRGTSYIGRDEYNSNSNNNNNNGGPTIATSVSSSNTVLRGIGCLIFASTILFLLAPAPNTHEGGVGGGILRTVPEPSSSVNGIHNNNDNNNYNNNDPRERTRKLPIRIQSLLAQSQIVGGHLAEVKEGKKTVEEIIHGGASLAAAGTNNNDNNNNNNNSNPNNKNNNGGGSGIGSTSNINPGSLSHNHKSAPMTLDEITSFLTSFLKKLNSSNLKNKRATPHGIWAAYHLLVSKWLYPWDQEYLTRMPMRREEETGDDSMFVSVVSFRDEHCPDTLKGAFAKAKHPDKLFVGLVQQNCQDEKTCHSGVTMEDTSTTNTGPDPDCYSIFCNSNEGKHYCTNGHVRLLQMKESESLGPYMARYFASKLWMGEEWYMQIDSHMTFLQDWDALAISMLKSAPSERPVISHLPPPHTADLSEKMQKAAPRLCGPVFATSDLESQIIRLEGSYTYDSVKLDIPRFAPFVAAGYLVAPSTILRDVPFDPFLPYIFMGEEILLSARLWTAGYDMFSPTHSLVGHRYVRNNRAPKFWESLHRAFTFGVHNPLQMLVLNRVKTQLGYPESAKDMLKPKSLFTAVEQYSMGTTRSLDDYLKMVGLNMVTKEVTYTAWCETGVPPPGFEQYSKLYEM